MGFSCHAHFGPFKDDHDGEERDGSNSTLRGVRHFAQRASCAVLEKFFEVVLYVRTSLFTKKNGECQILFWKGQFS